MLAAPASTGLRTWLGAVTERPPAHLVAGEGRMRGAVGGEGRGARAIGEGTTEKVASELLAKGLPVSMVVFMTFFFFSQSRPEGREIVRANR